MHTTFEAFLYESIDAIPHLKISGIVRARKGYHGTCSRLSNQQRIEYGGAVNRGFRRVDVNHTKVEDREQMKSPPNSAAKALRCSMEIGEVLRKMTFKPVRPHKTL